MTQSLAIVLLFLLLCLIGGVGFYSLQNDRRTPPVFACTMDALVCPDGSAVGRTGPSCAFAACPTTGQMSGILSSENDTFSLIASAQKGQAAGNIVPLDVSSVTVPSALIGKSVTVSGTYLVGNIFAVTAFVMPTTTITKIEPVTEAGPVRGIALTLGGSSNVGGIKITLNHIVSDSRCPVDVQCIQAGNVVANVTLQGELDTETTDISSQSPHVFGRYQVTIVDITPVRKNSTPFDSGSYRIAFSVLHLD